MAELHKPPFEKINVNGRVPAIEDPNTGITLWESGAIIEYLQETYDKNNTLNYTTTPEKYLVKQWLHFQVRSFLCSLLAPEILSHDSCFINYFILIFRQITVLTRPCRCPDKDPISDKLRGLPTSTPRELQVLQTDIRIRSSACSMFWTCI